MTLEVDAHANSSINTDLFRKKVATACRLAGRLQRELAIVLGINPQVLSRKLHGGRQASLTHAEVKQIIKTLASWNALATKAEAIDMLSCMGLKAEIFSEQEWSVVPLSQLEAVRWSGASVAIPLSTLAPVHMNTTVPASSTSLLGREKHVQALLLQLRQTSVRILTLLGPGGVGKTRLALEVTYAIQADFADGVFFVSLATLRDVALVPSTIMQALHLSEPIAREPYWQNVTSHIDMLKDFLCEKELLLVLDNVEQIPAIAPFLSDLLQHAARLKVMTTSRSVLHLYGEREFVVPPLEVHAPDQVADPEVLAQVSAIRLFVERAQAINPAFQITHHNAATIAHICARLDGLPLAIELAAARTKVLSLPLILQRLTDSMGQSLVFLRSTTLNVPSRHQTLHNTLDWSYGLLDPLQQCLFRCLSVFIGSWTVDAALTICMTEFQEMTRDAVLEQLEALIDQSLVKGMSLEESPLEEPREPHFHYLETVREYALWQLRAHGEHDDMQQRHASYYLTLVESCEPELFGPQQATVVSMLSWEQDNLRAALSWAFEHNQAAIAQRMCGTLGKFWEARTQFHEAHRWIDAALKMTQETPPAIRAKLLMAASRLALWEVTYEQSRVLAQEALVLYEAIGDVAGKAGAIFQIGDTWHMQGDYAQAITYLKESLFLLREQANWGSYAFTLSRLGAVAMLQGNFSDAWTWLNEAVPLLRKYSEPDLLNVTLVYLGALALIQGDFMQSMAYLREGLVLAQGMGNHYVLASDLIAFGCLLGIMREPSYAARICSAAEVFFESLGSALPAAYGPLYHTYLGSVQSQVDETTWQKWWTEGQNLSAEEICALALHASEVSRL